MNIANYIDHLLRNREEVIQDLQNPDRVSVMTKVCFVVFALLTVFYGLVMGSQNVIHAYTDGWKYLLAAAVKLPLLFLLTLAICMPLLYVLNVLIGPRAHFRTIFGILMASLSVTSILLGACAPILLFFMLSTKSYPFIILLNVAIFSVAGLYGVWFLGKAVASLAPGGKIEEGVNPHGSDSTIITWWLITYGIVGTQMAWLMRPFIGSPDQPFSFFRPQESNFYIAVGRAIGKLLMGG